MEYIVVVKEGHEHIRADGFVLDNGDLFLYRGDFEGVAAYKEWVSIREVAKDECSDLNELTN